MDKDSPGDEIAEQEEVRFFTTQRRIVVAIVALVVVGILLAVINAAIKTHKTTHESFANVSKLDIKVGNGSLRLVSNAGNAIDVERKVDYLLRGPSLSQKIKGDTLVIRQNCSGLHIGECDTDYTISVPNGVATTVTSSAGSVNVDGLQGDIGATTSGGKIVVDKTYGALTLKTDGGQIMAKDLSSQRVASISKGGKIALEFAAPPLQVDATSADGDVNVQVPKSNLSYQVDANSANSKSTVDVKNDSNSPRTIKAHSNNGKVSVAGS